MSIKRLFPTQIYYAPIAGRGVARLNEELFKESYQIRDADPEGRKWSKKNYPGGYTSYGSMSELFRLSSTFDQLRTLIDRHVLNYAWALDMDTKSHKLEMTNLWVNIVPKFTYHSLHLHPVSSISGTYYVRVPKNSGAIKFEDPRMTCFMASVPRRGDCKVDNKRFISINPKPGRVLLFESWLRHEVLQNLSDDDRVSISFNYNWF